jgi:purine-binding chemotaxis protein CheW
LAGDTTIQIKLIKEMLMKSPVAVTPDTSTSSIARSGRGAKAGQVKAVRGQLYLSFVLGSELFAIDIVRVREIIEYTLPTVVPMMPPTLRGVINVRGSVVPVVDLALRFGWQPQAIGRRTSIVIVEIQHNEETHVLGLVVDRVNAVTEIRREDIDAPPAFGARVDADFISGMARCDGRFVIILNIERALSVTEMAAISSVGETGQD